MKPDVYSDKFGLKVKCISNAFDTTINRFTADMDLTSAQSYILGYLASNRDKVIYQKDLEAEFNIKHPTITGILKRLTDKGFVQCIPDERDRRFKRVVATEKGCTVQLRARDHIRETERSLLTGLTDAERAELYRLLNKVLDNVTLK